MTTTCNKEKLFAAAAALAVGATPAVLFGGAGTSLAGPVPNPSSPGNGTIHVQYTLNPLGLTANILDNKNPPGVTERCHYHSVGTGLTPPIPFDADAFPNGPNVWGSLFIPTMPMGGTWKVTITCDHGGTFTYDATY
jgi:hypothetical protein